MQKIYNYLAVKKSYKPDDLKRELTSKQYNICVLGGTEAPYTGKYNKFYEPGIYRCSVCKSPLFSSNTKYDSKSGWPSFWDVLSKGSVEKKSDSTFGMQRTEILCSKCGSHLGHVFDDGPQKTPQGKKATGLRYCVNSASLEFVPKGGEQE